MGCLNRERAVHRNAFTLVELLSTMAILGLLMAILLPATQIVRESARRATCTNHIRQLGMACIVHESNRRHLPAGGWSYEWSPDPDRGYGREQPGTWTFNILSYLDESSLRNRGQDGRTSEITDRQLQSAASRMKTPVSVFQCPSRRSAQIYPASIRQHNCLPMNLAARSDFAACAGAKFLMADVPETALTKRWRPAEDTGGVIFQASTVKIRSILDGASHTYLLGEKFAEPKSYTESSVGESYGMWSFEWGVARVASEHQMPWRDQDVSAAGGAALGAFRFGGPHPGGWNAVFVDGSVRHLGFDQDAQIHARSGRRNDAASRNPNPKRL